MRSSFDKSLLIIVDSQNPVDISLFSNFYIKVIPNTESIIPLLLHEQFDAVVISCNSISVNLMKTYLKVEQIWSCTEILVLGSGFDNKYGFVQIETSTDAMEMKRNIEDKIFNVNRSEISSAFFNKYLDLTHQTGGLLHKASVLGSEKKLAEIVTKIFPELFVSIMNVNTCSLELISQNTESVNFVDFLKKEICSRTNIICSKISCCNWNTNVEPIVLGKSEHTYETQRLISIPMIDDNVVSSFIIIYFTKKSELSASEIKSVVSHMAQSTYTIHQTRELSSRDSLTGLYNHNYFEQALAKMKDESILNKVPMSLAMLDIDYFKNINDSYGHHIGDLLIIELSRLITSVTKKHDIVSRCGGDEMVVLLPNTDASDARHLAERLLETIRDFEFTAAGSPLHFTISIGLSSFDPQTDNADYDLRELSDKAMYLAKKSGRNQYCVANDIVKKTESEVSSYSEYNSRTLAQYQNDKLGKGRVLVVDDDAPIVALLTQLLQISNYNVTSTTSSRKALQIVKSEPDQFDVVLTDINMPEMNGIELLKSIRNIDPNVVGVIITAFASTQNTIEALRAGAYNLIQKPFDIDEINLIVERAVERRRLKRQLDAYHVNLEEVLKDKTKALNSAISELKNSYLSTMETIIRILDFHETTMANHSQRVSQLSVYLAQQMGITNVDSLNTIKYGALLHDIGKIGISDSILTKPDKLTEDEWKMMRTHPEIGFSIVKTIPVLAGAAEMVYGHHEKFDGSGYPRGLSSEQICIEARIFAVIDTYDALRYHRCYQDAQPLDSIVNEINRCSGTHFDPEIVNVFNNCYQQLDELTLDPESLWEQTN